jgi:ABC-type transport system substrate-binding protein
MIVGAGGVLVFINQSTRPPVDAYVFERLGDPSSLDPHIFWGRLSGDVIEQAYETLYTYPWGTGERGGHPEITPTIPLLAASAPVITENSTVYTIPLRQGITFHDGTPFNASTAVWNFKRAMKMFDTFSPVMTIAEAIKGGMQVKDAALIYGPTSDEFKAAFDAWQVADAVEATSTYEVTYRLEGPAAYFIPAMTNMFGCMMSPTFAEKHASTPGISFGVDYGEELTYMYNHTCGTGPYQVVEWKKGEYVHMTLDEDYWRADATEAAIAPPSYAGSIKEIRFRISKNWNWTIKSNNLMTGLIDDTYWPIWYADEIYDNVTMGSKDPNIFFRTGGVPSSVIGLSFEMGLLNWTGYPDRYEAYSPFRWRELRNMVAYLLDYDSLNYDYDPVFQGTRSDWTFQAKGPIPIGMPYQNSSYWTEHYDLETAVEYWNEAMQDPVFIDTMNTIGCNIPLVYFGYNDTLEQVYLQLKDGFEAMKQQPQMNTTGLNHEPGIRFWDPRILIFHYNVPIGRRNLIYLSGSSADYADPDSFVFSNLHSRGRGAQNRGYNNSEMDDLIIQGRAETDPVVRQQIYNQIQELAAHDHPILWLYSLKEFTVFGAWLKGIGMRYNPMFYYYYIYHVYKDYAECWWDYTTTDTTTTTQSPTTSSTPTTPSPTNGPWNWEDLPYPVVLLIGMGGTILVLVVFVGCTRVLDDKKGL